MNLDLAWRRYNDGGFQEAVEICRTLVRDGDDPDARACLAMSELRLGNYKMATKCLKQVARDRPDEWLIGVLRRHLPDIELGLDALLHLGRFINQALPILGPIQENGSLPNHVINVVGSSHVRSFGVHRIFFPIFIGIAHTTLLLTDSLFAATREKFLTNIARMDGSRDLLVILGSDPRLHWKNEFDTRETNASAITDHDRACMHQCALRHKDLLEEIMRNVTGRVVLYNGLPTFESRVNELTVLLNTELREICSNIGAGFLDIYDSLTVPELGILRREYAARAFEGDMHLNAAAIPLVVEALAGMGIVPPEIASEDEFEWSHVYRFAVGDGEQTRIWCEPDVSPNNALESDMFAASWIGWRALTFLSPFFIARDPVSLLVINVREGFLPLNIPSVFIDRCVAVTETAQRLEMARNIAHFSGRPDIEFTLHAPGTTCASAGGSHDWAIAIIHPASRAEDCARAREILGNARADTLLLLATDPGIAREFSGLGYAFGEAIPIGRKQLSDTWRESCVVMGSPAATG